MRVVFRVDSNEAISGGHVARCLSLADALSAAGHEVLFASSDGNPAAAVSAAGYGHVVLGGDWRDLGSDCDELRGLVTRWGAVLLVVDSYSVDRSFVESVADAASVCYLGSKGGYLGPLAALVNYSTDIDRAAYERDYAGQGTELLLGPRYAPLRAQFQNLDPIEIAPAVRRVLVSTGGTDPRSLAPEIVRAVLGSFPPGERPRVSVVVGAMSPARAELGRMAAGDGRVEPLSGVTDMAGLMRSCDLAVSANGTTVYELAACGVPAVTFAMVGEQRRSGEGMARLGMVRYCGCAEGGARRCVGEIGAAVAELACDAPARSRLAEAAHEVVDGDGAARVAAALVAVARRRVAR